MKTLIGLLLLFGIVGCKSGEGDGAGSGPRVPDPVAEGDALKRCGVQIDTSSVKSAALGWMRAKRGCELGEADVESN